MKMMKKFLNYMFAAGLLFTLCACDKTEDNENPSDGTNNQQPTVDESIVGYYSFNGKELPFRAIYNEVGDNGYTFLFTEQEAGTPATTYLYFGLSRDLAETVQNVGQLWRGMGYVMVYETPEYYFSEYYNDITGSALVEDFGDDYYHVMLDVNLANGMPFKLDYTGHFTRLQ